MHKYSSYDPNMWLNKHVKPTQFSLHQPPHKWLKELVIFIIAFTFFSWIATWFRERTTGWTAQGSNSCKGNKHFRSPKRHKGFCDSRSLLFNLYRGSLPGEKRPEPYVATNLRLARRFKWVELYLYSPYIHLWGGQKELNPFYFYRINEHP